LTGERDGAYSQVQNWIWNHGCHAVFGERGRGPVGVVTDIGRLGCLYPLQTTVPCPAAHRGYPSNRSAKSAPDPPWDVAPGQPRRPTRTQGPQSSGPEPVHELSIRSTGCQQNIASSRSGAFWADGVLAATVQR